MLRAVGTPSRASLACGWRPYNENEYWRVVSRFGAARAFCFSVYVLDVSIGPPIPVQTIAWKGWQW